MYYKLLKQDKFIGIGTSYNLRKFQLKHRILLLSDENNAQYIQVNDNFYRDDWFCPLTTDSIPYEKAKVISIDEEEYNKLNEAIESNKEIEVWEKEWNRENEYINNNIGEQSPTQTDENEETTKEFLKQSRINQLKKNLLNTDYVVIKIAEQVATFEEYSDIIEQRKSWRKEINELMDELNALIE